MYYTNYLDENRPMRQFKNFLILILYILLLNYLYFNKNILVFLGIIFISVIFIIKFQISIHKNKTINMLYKERLNYQRNSFISTLSHDLRIPVLAQIRALELFKNNKIGSLNETQKDMVNQIEQSNRLILNLISLMINTYNMENSIPTLKYERFNVSEVVISCFNELLNDVSEKNVTFEYKSDNKSLLVTADKEDIRKVIYNLLSASVSYVPNGDKIIVGLKEINDKIQLSVYTSTINSQINYVIKNPQYTSIGESIRLLFCKRIIEMHKGRFIQSNQPHMFGFELPKIKAKV